MIAVTTLIVVLFLSLIVVRIAAEALVLTGMAREAARFQARSAWTGTGFTTAEAEQVVRHPVRRRIIGMLMVARGAGLLTAASTLILSFVGVEDRDTGFLRIAVLAAGIVAVWLISRSAAIEAWMSRVIARELKKRTDIDVRDYAGLLHLAGEYAIIELMVEEGSWLAGRTLGDLALPDEGVLVLGVAHPDGTYLGAPRGATPVRAGDILVLYGRAGEIARLGERKADPAGVVSRREAVAEEEAVERREGTRDGDGALPGIDEPRIDAPGIGEPPEGSRS
ncbi:TrkA C-terminal domain-containing protein [Salinarimonas sp.]|uniref:TrkA C-terminal domain-containing protein n=1 Tax=Salinarimonas sp. TaxID=2766526 RepID=UPI0032D97C59